MTSEEDREGGLRRAEADLGWLQAHEETARRCVASVMCEVYNECWREEDEPMTEEGFVQRIEILRVAFEEDGSFILSYDPGDLFGGHLVDGKWCPNKGFRGAHLVG